MPLQDVINDRTSGSLTVAREILEHYLLSPPPSSEHYLKECKALLGVHGEMVTVINALNTLAYNILDKDGAGLHTLCNELITLLDSEIDGASDALVRVIESEMAERIPLKVMTLSCSTQVTHAIERLHSEGMLDTLIVLESRPLNEGRKMALTMAKKGIKTVLVVDAMAYEASEIADIALYGCDAIIGERFVNKIGTRCAIMANAVTDTRAYVMAGSWKHLPAGLEELYLARVGTERNPDEVWKAPAQRYPGLNIINKYFELSPLERAVLVDGSKGENSPLFGRAHREIIKTYIRSRA